MAWHSGIAAPSNSKGVNGDMYVLTVGGYAAKFYEKISGIWDVVATFPTGVVIGHGVGNIFEDTKADALPKMKKGDLLIATDDDSFYGDV